MRSLIGLAVLCPVLLCARPAFADKGAQALQLIDQGILLYKAGDLIAARATFAKARELVPDKANPYRWLGVTDARLNRCADAVTELETFLARVPADDARTIEAITIRDRCREELQPKLGTIAIDTTPPGAEVRLDDEEGAPVGKTPYRNDKVTVGNHVIILRKPGYQSMIKTVTVGKGETVRLDLTLSQVKEESKVGTLMVESTPSGADVRIDDETAAVVGKTPYRTDALRTGSHVVFVHTAGFATTSRGVTIGPRETVRLDLQLEAVTAERRGPLSKHGTLVVDSTPTGATVRLDDEKTKPIGDTPLRHEIAPGSHAVLLSRSGFKALSHNVSVARGETVRLDLSLEKKSYGWLAAIIVPVVLLGLGAGVLAIAASQQRSATTLDPVGTP